MTEIELSDIGALVIAVVSLCTLESDNTRFN